MSGWVKEISDFKCVKEKTLRIWNFTKVGGLFFRSAGLWLFFLRDESGDQSGFG